MTRALVRSLPDAYADATVRLPLGAIDVGLARAQHAAYVAALQAAGATVTVLPQHPSPDSCFVEDQAVVFAGRALVTRSGHPGRRAEADSVAAGLAQLGVPYRRMRGDDATLDGGDVLRVGRVLFVGRSARTNDAGIVALADAFASLGAEIRPLDVADLHLKCVVSSPAPGVVLLAEGTLDPEIFAGAGRVFTLPAEQAYAANTVGVGKTALCAAGFPAVADALAQAGLTAVPLDMSELRKGDGALTCLSILL